MVLLLNYLPYIILAIAAYIGYKQFKKHKDDTTKKYERLIQVALGTITIQIILMALTASYMPKGSVAKLGNPTFDIPEYNAPQIEDRLRKPVKTAEEAKKDFDEMVDWRKSKAPES